MTRTELSLLERAFAAEIDAAFTKQSHLVQTTSAAAKRLEQDGLLRKRVMRLDGGWPPVEIEGYELTHAGRMLYCSTCDA